VLILAMQAERSRIRTVARVVAEVVTRVIGIALIVCAVGATQPWLDRHFLPSFLLPREWYVRIELAGRLALALAGAVLVRATPRVGQLVEHAPSSSGRIAVAALLAVVASEPALRGMHLQPAQWLLPDEEPLRRADARLGWTLVPARTGRAEVSGRRVEYAIDAAGYRVRDAARPVDVTQPSVLFTGESVMFGEGLTWDESVPAQVEAALGVQSANLAVHGFATDQAYMHLEHELPRFERPLGVVTLFMTSLFGRNLDHRRPHLGPGLTWMAPRPEWQLQSLARLIVPYHGDAAIDDGVATTREVLHATAALARSRGAAPLVVVLEFGPEDPQQQWIRTRVLDGSGVHYVRVTLDPAWRLPWDRHPDARGARAIAHAIARRLRGSIGEVSGAAPNALR